MLFLLLTSGRRSSRRRRWASSGATCRRPALRVELVPDLGRRRGTRRRATSPRCVTCGASRSRSSSTCVWPIVMVLLLRTGTRKLADLHAGWFSAALAVDRARRVAAASGSRSATPRGDARGVLERRRSTVPRPTPVPVDDHPAAGCCSALHSPWCGGRWRSCADRCATKAGARHRRHGSVSSCSVSTGVALDFMGPDGADPWLFRGGFLLGDHHTRRDRRGHHRRTMTSRRPGPAVLLWIGTPLVRAVPLPLADLPDHPQDRRQASCKFHEFVVAMVATAIVITELSYRYIETPIREGNLGGLVAIDRESGSSAAGGNAVLRRGLRGHRRRCSFGVGSWPPPSSGERRRRSPRRGRRVDVRRDQRPDAAAAAEPAEAADHGRDPTHEVRAVDGDDRRPGRRSDRVEESPTRRRWRPRRRQR